MTRGVKILLGDIIEAAKLLDRYTIEHEIGAGGTATVYLREAANR